MYNQDQIEQLIQDNEEFRRDLAESDRRIALLESESSQGGKTPDILFGSQGRKDLESLNSERIMEVIWNDFLYFSPFLADAGRFLDGSSGTGSSTIDSNGVVVQTGVTSGGVGESSLPLNSSVSRTRETRFKATAQVNSLTNITALVGTFGVNGTSAAQWMGFAFKDGILYGRSSNGTTATDVSLQSYAVDTNYLLEVYLYPLSGLKFFVDGIEKGAISDGNDPLSTQTKLPSGTSNIYVFSNYIINSAAANKIMYVSYAEFMQRRK